MNDDVFTTWAKKFKEIKFYTLQRDRESCGNAEADNWLKLINSI
jgi:hypothetical protein